MSTLSSSKEKSASILLVDGSQHGSVARRRLLEDQGHKITFAPNPEEALEAFARDRFDLVVTDFKMPVMNGIELIDKVRKIRPDVGTVLLHGYAEGMGLDERSSGADAVVSKGANEVGHLLRAVNRLVNRAHRKPAASQRTTRLRGRAKGA